MLTYQISTTPDPVTKEHLLSIKVTANMKDELQKEPKKVSINYLLDVSWSMNGEKLDCVKQVVINSIKNLDDNAHYTIKTFSDKSRCIVDNALKGDKETLAHNLKLIQDLEAQNGTNILSVFGKEKGIKFLLTDGEDNYGVKAKNIIEKWDGKDPIFTIGMGPTYNEGLLRDLAKSTGSEFTRHIKGKEDIFQVFEELQTQIMSRTPRIILSVQINNKIVDYPVGSLGNGQSNTIVIPFSAADSEKCSVMVRNNIDEIIFKEENLNISSVQNEAILAIYASREGGDISMNDNLNKPLKIERLTHLLSYVEGNSPISKDIKEQIQTTINGLKSGDENERRKGASQLSGGSQRHDPFANSYVSSYEDEDSEEEKDDDCISQSLSKNASAVSGFFSQKSTRSTDLANETIENNSANNKNIARIAN